MSIWESIKDAILDLASTAIEGSISGFVPLSKIGMTLIANGALKDYGSGEATKRQLDQVLAAIKRYGGSCEIKMGGEEILVKVNFQ